MSKQYEVLIKDKAAPERDVSELYFDDPDTAQRVVFTLRQHRQQWIVSDVFDRGSGQFLVD